MFFAIVMMAFALVANAQSGTNSPYSQFGLGILSDQTSGFNRGMNGLGIGYRQGNQVNFINPASYSSMDSLTFIFDAGISGQITNFEENGVKKNAKNANFEYVVAAFRLRKHLGVSIGILPFTNVGYNYSSTESLNDDRSVIYTNTYDGKGGIRQVYLGIGWEPIRNLSVGANFSYLWGNFERTISNVYSESTAKTLNKIYKATFNDYQLNFGAQYSLPLNTKDVVTLGATFSPKHRMGADPECLIISSTSTSRDTTTHSVENGFELPMMVSAGLMFSHNKQLNVGVDYSLQRWGSTTFPVYGVENNQPVYKLSNDYFMDRHKINVGGEYCRGRMARRFIDRLHYRAGVSYATPYVKINGHDGPKEISVSAGFGIPIVNGWNNRSFLNISGQWVRQSGKGMITENSFRINIGVTFNERWFQKWQVE